MCPWEHLCAYGVDIDGRSCLRWCTRELSYNSAPAATQPSWRFCTDEGVEHKVHVSVGTFMCVWSGHRRSIVPEVVDQRVVVQFGSTCNLAEWAISSGRRCRAQGTCVRGNIYVRMEWKSTLGRARGGASESCRTIQLHLQLSRVGDSARMKVSSTWYMCPWEHFRAYEVEIVGRSCPRWCTRELSYTLPPAATQPSWRFRPAEGVEHGVHVSVGTFSCV